MRLTIGLIINVIAIIFLIFSIGSSSYLFIDIYKQLEEKNIIINNYPADEIPSQNGIETTVTGDSYDDVIDTDFALDNTYDLFANFITWINSTEVNIKPETHFKEDAEFLKDLNIGGSASVEEDLNVGGELNVEGGATFEDKVTIDDELEINGISLSDNTSLLSGASLVGLYDNNYTNISGNTTVQGAIGELDTAVASATHNPVTLAAGLNYLTLSGQEITLNQIDITTDVLGATLSVSELNFLDGSTVANGGLVFGNGTNLTQDAANLFWDDGTNRLGIGTTAPESKLTLAGGATIGSGYTGIGISAPLNGLLVQGNVGIGNTNPRYKLDVVGSVNAYDLIAHNLLLSSSSTSLITALKGFDGYTDFTGGVGTGGNGKDSITGAQRLTSTGNLVNIGSIQSGEISATRGGTFAARVNYTTGGTPRSVEIGDLDGDGKADLVVANAGSSSVSVLINNGDGTFAAKVDYTTGALPYFVKIGDLNGDGKADLMTGNGNSNSISVLMNDGDGTFAAKVDYAAGANTLAVAIGDLNGDGKADLAVTNNGAASVSVFVNNGDGTFATRVDYAAGTNPWSIAIGDLNGDGKADLAVANFSSTSISVFTNNGDGTFAAKVDYATATSPDSVAIGDVNGDGKADLAVANYGSTSISVFTNNGDGTFAAKVDYASGTNPASIAIGDVNGDGKADLAVANYGSTSISVFINNGDGTFAAKVDYATALQPFGIAMRDIDSDGKADLAVVNPGSNNVSTFINNTQSILYAGTTTGNIGIGTTAPESKLSLAGGMTIGSGYTGIGISAPLNGLLVQGNVGIGTTNPATDLDINGDLRLNGYIEVAKTGPNVLISNNQTYASDFISGSVPGGDVSIFGNWSADPDEFIVGSYNDFGGGFFGMRRWDTYNGEIGLTLDTLASSGTSMFANGGTGIQFSDGEIYMFTSGYKKADFTDDYIKYYKRNSDQVKVELRLDGFYESFLDVGDLGIGTTDPSYRLDVTSGTTDNVARFISSDDLSQILVSDNDTTGYLNVKDSKMSLGLTSGLSASNLVIDSSGRVGIGTTAPESKLTVAGGATIGSGYTGIGISSPLNGLLVQGNTGIGSTNPASQFNVGTNNQFQVNSTGNIVKLNNVTTSFPSSQGGAGSILTNDGAGTLTWGSPSGTGTLGYWQRNGTDLAPANIGDNVGIGTTAPLAKLHLEGVGLQVLYIKNTTTAVGAQDHGSIDFYGVATSDQLFKSSRILDTAPGINRIGQLEFQTGYANVLTTIMTLTAVSGGGNVGIGTTSPTSLLTIQRSTNPTLSIKTETDPSIGDTIGTLRFQGPGDHEAARIRAVASEVDWPTSRRSSIHFDVLNVSSVVPDVMVIANTGNVGIGTTGPTAKLHISHDMVPATSDGYAIKVKASDATTLLFGANATDDFTSIDSLHDYVSWTTRPLILQRNGGSVGIGTVSPGTHKLSVVGTAGLSTGTAWTNTSDSRFKDVQSELYGSALEKISQLRPVTYNWNELHDSRYGEDPGLNYGFIAQEVAEVIPEMISRDAEGYYYYNPSGFEAILTAAVQEQQVMIDLNTSSISSISTLGNRITELENKLEMVTSDPIFNSDSVTQKDLSESYPTLDTTLEPGDVVVLDTPVQKASSSADLSKYMVAKSDGDDRDRVLGIVSGKSEEQVKVALAGRVPVKYDTANGKIKAGDLLAVSNEESGKVVKATENGWVVGRALEDSSSDKEMIMMFVSLTWYTGEVENLAFNTNAPVDLETLKAGLESILEIQGSADGTGKQRAVFFSDMNIMGNVTADSFSTLGEISSGFLTIDGTDDSISVLGGGDLKLQNGINPGNIDAFNGALVLTSDGGIIAKAEIAADIIVARKVAVLGETTVAEQAISADGSTVGEGTLGSGLLEVTINNANVKPNSKVFITPTTGTGGKALIVKQKADGSFTVSIDSAHNAQIDFDYWIVEVR